jgi:hypothetical protein
MSMQWFRDSLTDHTKPSALHLAQHAPPGKTCRRLFDLGQFERFRRIMRTPPYVTLLGHHSATLVSSLEVRCNVLVSMDCSAAWGCEHKTPSLTA